MKKEITFSDLYWNDRLRGFCFRRQAEDTFNEVMQNVVDGPETERMMGEFLESMFDDVDDLEEYFYNGKIQDIIDEFCEYHGIEADEDED